MALNLPSFSDTVVIGGGTAGAAIAGLLARLEDQSVLLLEAGPDYGLLSDGQWPEDLLDGRVVATTHDWGYTSASGSGEPSHSLQRARVIGGCSSHNGCIALWGSRVDYDGWVAGGNAGWSTDELLPFFQRATTALQVREFASNEITPFHAGCWDAMVQAGIRPTKNLNDMDENVAAGIAPVNILNGTRRNTSIAYLDPVRDSRHLKICGEALVDRIILAGRRAVSLEVMTDGKRTSIDVGRVILCAGTYNSPAVLLRSGIGAPDYLKDMDIEVAIDLPGVGENLHDHPAITLRYTGTQLLSDRMKASVNAGASVYTEQSIAKVSSSQCVEAFDLHIFPTSSPKPNKDGLWECHLSVANMAPKSRGRITLASTNPIDHPVIDTGYLSDPFDSDLSVLMEGLEITRQIKRHDSLATLIGRELPHSASLVDPESVRRGCLHYYHPVGTCKMGPASDSLSVVGSQGRVHGTDNVYVSDASIMPTIPRANTNLPTLMAAERVASWLSGGASQP